jgi:hypothetical protein
MGSSPLNPDASAPSDSAPAVQNGGSDTTSNIEAGIGEAASKVDGSGESGSSVEDFAASASDFDCSRNSEWTTVGLAHYKNALGHTEEMLTVARSSIGGTFPVGTIVQLNPAEAMVKRGQGFDATSNDWEFFTLTDSDAGSTINHRGGGTSVSNARATCLSCHLPAQSTFDLICGDPVEGGPTTTHGCVPLPVSTAVLAALPDPRCP